MYQGMQPGQNGGMPGMGAPLQSYISAINGLPGFGGIPAQQLIQALMSGYAGVPMAQQPTGTQAPGMATQQPITNTTAPTTGPTNDANSRRSRGADRARRRSEAKEAAVSGSGAYPRARGEGYGEGGDGGETGGGGPGDPGGVSDSGMGMAGEGTEGSGDEGGGMYAKGGPVRALSGPNPRGPDDGYAALDRGEFVVRAKQAKKHKGLLHSINSGRYGNKKI
jgi:hypothetical protein